MNPGAAGRPAPGRHAAAVGTILVAVTAASLLLDTDTRFLFGDSRTYMVAGLLHFVPWERSWTYGLLLELLRRAVPDTRAIVGLNVLAYALVQFGLALHLRRGGASLPVVGLFLACTGFAPSLFFNERAVLTDTLALAAYLAYLAAASRALDRGRYPARLGLTALLAFVLVSLRTAYVPVALLTLPVAAGLDLLLRPPARARLCTALWLVLASAAGAAGYACVNGALFHEAPTFNRAGPRFLLGVMAPALDCPTLRSADPGFDCALIERWNLGDYARRNDNTWADDRLIAATRRLAAERGQEEFVVQRQILRRMLRTRLPEMAAVYGWTLVSYLDPRSYIEAGTTDRVGIGPFPPDFLPDVVRPRWTTPWDEATPTRPSLGRWLITSGQVLDWPCVIACVAAILAAPLLWRRADAFDRMLLAGSALYLAALPLFSADMYVRYAMPLTLAGIWFAARWLPPAVLSARRRR